MKARTKDIDPGTPAGIKKWAEQRLALLEELRADTNQLKLSKYYEFDTFKIQMWTMAEQDFLRIKGGCKDRKGFLLDSHFNNDPGVMADEFTAHYDDGVNELINPITGEPRPDPDPAEKNRTKFYVLPPQLRHNPHDTNTNSGRFTGIMRQIVGCYHLRGIDAPFNYTFGATHGVAKFQISTNKFVHYVIEISASGVYAAPIEVTTRCCDSGDITDYVPTDEQIAEQPSLQIFKDTLSLNWAFGEGRANVQQLLDAAGIADAYATGIPWYAGCGWAFSGSGQEAQAVTIEETSSPTPTHYLCSRYKLAFSRDSSGTVSAVLTTEDLQEVAAFPDFSGVWTPTGAYDYESTDGMTAAQQASMSWPTQDAPVHVYYRGEEAIVTRWVLTRTSVPGGQQGCDTNCAVSFGVVMCRKIIATHIEPICAGDTAETFHGDVSNCGLSGVVEGEWITHEGFWTYGGVNKNPAAHTKIVAGFTSPLYSDLKERSSASKTINNTIQDQGPQELDITTQNGLFNLNPACWHDEVRTTPPFDTVTIKHAPVNYRRSEFWARAYVNQRVGTETFTARTNIAMFMNEREALLHTTRDAYIFSGTEQNMDTSGGTSRWGVELSIRYHKNFPVTSGTYPGFTAAQLDSPFTDSNGPGSGGNAIRAEFTSPGTTTPTSLDIFTPTASATLFLGSFSFTQSVPSESVAGGAMPATALSPFFYGSIGTPPVGVETISSPVYGLHSNMQTSHAEGSNLSYLLEFSTPVTIGGFVGVQDDSDDDVLAFVGIA